MKEEPAKNLFDLAQQIKESGIKHLFDQSSGRAQQFCYQCNDLFIDFSKTPLTDELINAYLDFIEEDLTLQRQKLFSGGVVNVTEQRAALHTLLRNPDNQGIELEDETDRQEAIRCQADLLKQIDRITKDLDASDHTISDIIHVGIGGSSLGPKLLYQALTKYDRRLNIHFSANIDGHEMADILSRCEANRTLIVGVSKTFKTLETLTNLLTIMDWFKGAGVNDYQQKFYAVTADRDNALAFGVPKSQIIEFPEWAGGRYSLWSAVSLSVALIMGKDAFTDFLQGASEMDKYFYQTPLQQNICFLASCLDHFNGNFLGAASRATFVYDYRLRSLVDYLQQLETESNGKDHTTDGDLVTCQTSPVIWGGVGTDAQHSVFQLMHQGTQFIPAEFILVKKADHNLENHHQQLLANGIAQSAALLVGQTYEEVEKMTVDESLSEITKKSKVFVGNKPSTTIILDSLTPTNLGGLIAFYEHRTFCNGVLANINSFDQMGVELGKRLANEIGDVFAKQGTNSDFDASTQNLLKKLRE